LNREVPGVRIPPSLQNESPDSVGAFLLNITMKQFHVYILKSEMDGSHYYGHSADLMKRLANHNSGKVRSTKSKRPWIVHYTETYNTKSEANKRELFFKSINGYNFLKEKKII